MSHSMITISAVPWRTMIVLLLITSLCGHCATSAYDFGTAANFIILSGAGAVANTGVSTFTGDVGSHAGAIAGFGAPSVLHGTIHNANPITLQASTDLAAACVQIQNTPTTVSDHITNYGNGESLAPGVYSAGAAATLTGALILDGQGDANAVFIFKIQGAFAAAAGSSIVLTNGASSENVYWIAVGAVALGAGSTMSGTFIGYPGAVSAVGGVALQGRLYATAGAIAVDNVAGAIPVATSAPTDAPTNAVTAAPTNALTAAPTTTPASTPAPTGPPVDPNTCSTAADCIANLGNCAVWSCTANLCELDSLLPSSTVCRSSNGYCDSAESCTGSSRSCPSDSKVAQGTVCRADSGACDTEELCDGSSDHCPADVIKAAGDVCRRIANICDKEEVCNGLNVFCPADHVHDSSTVCRHSVGACDVAETCTGQHLDCPADHYKGADVVCRIATGACDAAEVCTGDNATCPSDQLHSNSAVCRPAGGACGIAELCTGSSDACPADAHVASTTVCRASTGDPCDDTDICSGTSGACVDHGTCQCAHDSDCVSKLSLEGCESAICDAGTCKKQNLPAGAVCRDAAGPCDLVETCDGSSSCPADVFRDISPCRDASGVCDATEYCSGTQADCPADTFLDYEAVCRRIAGECDTEERCSGTSRFCPADALAPNTTTCRDSAGECDIAEQCTGAHIACPADKFRPVDTICRNSRDLCDKADTCVTGNPDCPSDQLHSNTTVCRAAGGACGIAELCTGSSDACPADQHLPDGTVCRAAVDPCDNAEICGGGWASSPAECPADTRSDKSATFSYAYEENGATTTSTYSCGRPMSGMTWNLQSCLPCYIAAITDVTMYECQKLTGNHVVLPLSTSTVFRNGNEGVCFNWPSECSSDSDCLVHVATDSCERAVCSSGTCTTELRTNGSTCRESAGFCDVAELCTGTQAACPTDLFNQGLICRDAAGTCDQEESCSGTQADCPVDTLKDSSQVCRRSAAACDVAEYCTGASIACPADSLAPSDTLCRAGQGDCDPAEFCNGTFYDCPLDFRRGSDYVCRASRDACDAAETCDSHILHCPADSLHSNTTVCRAAAGLCDVDEMCTGASDYCPSDSLAPFLTVCRAQDGACDVAETCSGTSSVCPVDDIASSGAICRESAGWCDVVEYCEGSSKECGIDTFLPSTDVCRHVDGGCDLAENCTGVNPFCPPDSFQPTSIECRASAGSCDIAEVCDGNHSACPLDVVESAGTVCRAGAHRCDIPEVCSGSSSACPSDARELAACDTCVDDDECFALFNPKGCEKTYCRSNGTCALEVRPQGHVCRADAGVCDKEEVCDGDHAACPDDALKATYTVCRSAASVCDVSESCSGYSAECPTDVFAPNSVQCRAPTVGFSCDEADFCTGSGYACPNDRVRKENATCQTMTGAISSCDGLVKSCSASRVAAANSELAAVAAPSERALVYRAGDVAYLCNVAPADLAYAPDGTASVYGCEYNIGILNSAVILPFPRCLQTCVSRTSPNGDTTEHASFYSRIAGDFAVISQTNVIGDAGACPAWSHVAATELLPLEGVAGGDPRYSVNGVMVQCDVVGEVLYAQNANYSVYVHHTPIPPHQATYIDSMRLVFAARHNLPEFSFSSAGWKSQSLKSAGGHAVAVHSAGVHSTGIPITLTVQVSKGENLKMLNFGFAGLQITSGIMVNGCPLNAAAVNTGSAVIPEHDACKTLPKELQAGCNFDMWASDGNADVAVGNAGMAEVVRQVDYQQPEVVVVTAEMKAAQTAAPTDAATADDAGHVGKSATGTSSDNTDNTVLIIAIACAAGTAIVLLVAVVFIVRHRKNRGNKTNLDGDDATAMTTKDQEIALPAFEVVIGLDADANPMHQKKPHSRSASARSYNAGTLTTSLSLNAEV